MSLLKVAIPLIYGAVASRGLSLILRLFVAANLAINLYSEYTLQVALFITLLPLATLSIATGLSRISSKKDEDLLDIYAIACLYIVFALSFLSTCLFIYLIPDEISQEASMLFIMCVFAGFLSQGIIAISAGTKLAKLEARSASKIEVLDSAIKLLFCSGFIFIPWVDFISLFLVYSACSMLTALLVMPRFCFQIPLRKILTAIKSLVRDCTYYSTCSLIILLFFYVVRESLYETDKVLAAQMDFALLLYSIPKLVMASIARAVIPVAGRHHLRVMNPKQTLSLFLLCCAVALSIYMIRNSSPVFVIFSILSIDEFLPSLTPLSLLIVTAIFDLKFGVKSSLFFSQGKQLITLSACALSFSLLYFIVEPLLIDLELVGAALLIGTLYICLLFWMFLIEWGIRTYYENQN